MVKARVEGTRRMTELATAFHSAGLVEFDSVKAIGKDAKADAVIDYFTLTVTPKLTPPYQNQGIAKN